MAKPNFSEMMGKMKTDASGLAEKIKAGTIEAAEKVKSGNVEVAGKVKTGTVEIAGKVKTSTVETADTLIKKISKKDSADDSELNAEEVTDQSQTEGQTAEESPKIKLDDLLRMAVDEYNDAYTIMNDNGATLYRERTRAVDMILHVEDLVNSIANRPKDFDTDIAEIQTNRESFTGVCEFAKAELDAAKKSALSAGAGVATGAAVVSVAPTVAMWVATTFGTASTGTAISALSGAAAQSAALAWLGGGALTAGGGGMAAGNALLAMAGPIGWGIAGVTLLSSIVLFSLNKMKLDKKKKEEIEAVKNNTVSAKKVAAQIQVLLDEVNELRDRLNQQYHSCLTDYGKDFLSISREHQIQLGVLVNNTKAIAASLSKGIA
jgi:hypothetical protein